jgi:Bacterial protein of unknown function (DUF885)
MKKASAVLFLVVLAAASAFAADAPAKAAWVARSDANARVLLDVQARFGPEGASQFGVEGFDTAITDLSPGALDRQRAALTAAVATLEERLAREQEQPVRQDLEILLASARQNLEGSALNERLLVPYFDAPQVVFFGVRGLLDDQVAPERRKAALARLRAYVGLEGGRPFLELAAARTRQGLAAKGLLPPVKAEVEKHLGNAGLYVDGIEKLLQKYGVAGYQEAHARLRTQVAAYQEFLKQEVLPKARTDFRDPPELYAFNLRGFGVDIPPAALAERARVSFMEIRNEMKALAPLVAAQKGLATSDYRGVIRELKKQQLVGDAILPHYQARLAAVEEIIRREKIVTLPARAARIRLASEAESAQSPAPNMRPPRLVGNTGELGEFVLPLRVPTRNADGTPGPPQGYDDFTFDAASWTLVAHEARPGHELQFAALVEHGVSLARAAFAFNSVNVEGWALYAEAEMKPSLPLDGQLIGLQHRLMRAARAFLDPELQAGQMEPEAAVRFLMDEVVLSEAMARQEVERYTFRAPGQATSYFYGYLRWMELKSRVELALGARFDRQRYHDFILSQGLLPPDTLGKAVLAEFVPQEKQRVQ